MKLPDRRDAVQRHFKKGHAGRVVNVFGCQTRRGRVHHLAPGPKTVLLIIAPIFRPSAQHALKCVRMRVDHAGQHRAIR